MTNWLKFLTTYFTKETGVKKIDWLTNILWFWPIKLFYKLGLGFIISDGYLVTFIPYFGGLCVLTSIIFGGYFGVHIPELFITSIPFVLICIIIGLVSSYMGLLLSVSYIFAKLVTQHTWGYYPQYIELAVLINLTVTLPQIVKKLSFGLLPIKLFTKLPKLIFIVSAACTQILLAGLFIKFFVSSAPFLLRPYIFWRLGTDWSAWYDASLSILNPLIGNFNKSLNLFQTTGIFTVVVVFIFSAIIFSLPRFASRLAIFESKAIAFASIKPSISTKIFIFVFSVWMLQLLAITQTVSTREFWIISGVTFLFYFVKNGPFVIKFPKFWLKITKLPLLIRIVFLSILISTISLTGFKYPAFTQTVYGYIFQYPNITSHFPPGYPFSLQPLLVIEIFGLLCGLIIFSPHHDDKKA